MMVAPCHRCGGDLQPGEALVNTIVGYPDFPGDTGNEAGCTVSESGPCEMIQCLKCVDCGTSYRIKSEVAA